jgi:hypothetical protein
MRMPMPALILGERWHAFMTRDAHGPGKTQDTSQALLSGGFLASAWSGSSGF